MFLYCPLILLCIGSSFAVTQWPLPNENRPECSISNAQNKCPTWFYCDEFSRECLPCAVCRTDQYPTLDICQLPAACAASNDYDKNILRCPDLPQGVTVHECYNVNILGSSCDVSCANDSQPSITSISCVPSTAGGGAEWTSASSICTSSTSTATTLTPNPVTLPLESTTFLPDVADNATVTSSTPGPTDNIFRIILPVLCAILLVAVAAIITKLCIQYKKSRAAAEQPEEQGRRPSQRNNGNSTNRHHVTNGVDSNASRSAPVTDTATVPSEQSYLLNNVNSDNLETTNEVNKRRPTEQDEVHSVYIETHPVPNLGRSNADGVRLSLISSDDETDVKQKHVLNNETETQLKVFT